MVTDLRDEIVEQRTWCSGVEIVSRINWSQVARLRRSLGISEQLYPANPFVQAARSPRAAIAKTRWWRNRIQAA